MTQAQKQLDKLGKRLTKVVTTLEKTLSEVTEIQEEISNVSLDCESDDETTN